MSATDLPVVTQGKETQWDDTAASFLIRKMIPNPQLCYLKVMTPSASIIELYKFKPIQVGHLNQPTDISAACNIGRILNKVRVMATSSTTFPRSASRSLSPYCSGVALGRRRDLWVKIWRIRSPLFICGKGGAREALNLLWFSERVLFRGFGWIFKTELRMLEFMSTSEPLNGWMV